MELNRSQTKWLFMIALAHVDNRFMKVEKDYLKEKVEALAHPAIRDFLISRIEEGVIRAPKPDFEQFAIKTPEDKIDVLFMAHELFWVDGHFDDREKFALDYILAKIRKDKDALLLLKDRIKDLDRKKPDQECLKAHIEDFFYG